MGVVKRKIEERKRREGRRRSIGSDGAERRKVDR